MADIDSLFDQLRAAKEQPIGDWQPRRIVELDIEVDAAGQWRHQGSGFQRQAIVKLFATVLRREGEEFFLVTPAVKYRIRVADAPFLAVEMQVRATAGGQDLYFRTNMDEVVRADRRHPLFVAAARDRAEQYPYIAVRAGLHARITRPVYYQLAELAEPSGGAYLLRSAGQVFRLG